jgi:hypothetical protein
MALLPVLVVLSGSPCFASTDCASTVASITVETGSRGAGYSVTLDSGMSFVMSPESQSYHEVLSLSALALNAGMAVTARFATNYVDCNRSARRTDLVAIVVHRHETATATPPSR